MPSQILPADTVVVVDTSDTTSAIMTIGREIDQAGRLMIEGEWDLFWTEFYTGLAELVLNALPKILGAILVFLVFYGIYRVLRSVIARLLRRSRRVDPGVERLLMKTYRVIGISVVLLMVVAQLGVNVAALLTAFGIAGIAIGFAARDTLENFISGITILMDKPFRIGDNVEVDGVFGTVDEITLRSTRIRTLNSEYMVMPNSQMINQKLINHTILGTVRVEVPFGIAYKEFPSEAREVVLKLTQGDPRLHPDFLPDVVVTELADSSVNLSLRLYLSNPKLEMPVKWEYTEKIREALRAADIEIPFPHRQLFIDEAKGLQGTRLLGRD